MWDWVQCLCVCLCVNMYLLTKCVCVCARALVCMCVCFWICLIVSFVEMSMMCSHTCFWWYELSIAHLCVWKWILFTCISAHLSTYVHFCLCMCVCICLYIHDLKKGWVGTLNIELRILGSVLRIGLVMTRCCLHMFESKLYEFTITNPFYIGVQVFAWYP